LLLCLSASGLGGHGGHGHAAAMQQAGSSSINLCYC
jgi:hypothetical protein